MVKLKELNPIIPVVDVVESAEFFEEVLGFNILVKEPHYASVKRDEAGFRLVTAGDNVGQLSCYIVVEGVDELYAELKPNLDRLPQGRVRPPFNQDYGMREFHVIDLDSLLIFFGEETKT